MAEEVEPHRCYCGRLLDKRYETDPDHWIRVCEDGCLRVWVETLENGLIEVPWA